MKGDFKKLTLIALIILSVFLGCAAQKAKTPPPGEEIVVAPDEEILVVPKDRKVFVPGEKVLTIPGEGTTIKKK